MSMAVWRMKMKKLIVSLLVVSMLGACAAKTEPEKVEVIKYQTRTVEKPKQILPVPDQVKMREVKWKVITQDDIPYFALDAKNYENLSLNLNDIRAFMSQAIVIIKKHNTN